jgi:hypothetical protein
MCKSERDISTYPFQATRPLSVLFSIEIQVPLSAAIEIARGGRRFGLKKQTLDVRFTPNSGHWCGESAPGSW